ncbi:CCA tRNA nucleotidyltransferase [Swaminathania salitolerans]|uniref:Poly(A) polymerase n=1 Tax=Swaminathania salitolerans TaxID=182838 RepID=A0A511BRY2_9PROT|nr:CCA tRNA nucleotidyltransferase [Swaminathania salitolerans]GBQ14550.1 polynucleotide adenylyltransferase [Swaminathania salitolerans LMG 21291]GEL03079.1 poly(A) polymerase [Swaminathania salitolerans]
MTSLLGALPDPGGLERLWSILPDARLVGGSVRDLLLGRADIHDIDLATPEPPDEVQRLLVAAGIKTVPTGLAHGTITAVIAHRPYEITTLRRDVVTDGRHAQVAWTGSWEEDAARRDFTINALFCDRFGVVHDYFGGRQDLLDRRVRFVGDPLRRIEEDALRILRFFRFDARFGTDRPDEEAMTAIAARVGLIDGLSAERLASEILRILNGPHLMGTLHHMQQVGALAPIVPDARLARLGHALAAGVPTGDVLRLGLLASSPETGRRLRLPVRSCRRLEAMHDPALHLAPDTSDARLRVLLADYSPETLIDRSWMIASEHAPPEGEPALTDMDANMDADMDATMRADEWASLRERVQAIAPPVFPLAGRDAVEAGLPPGPEVGKLLASVGRWWRAHGCLPDRAACLAELTRCLPLFAGDAGR